MSANITVAAQQFTVNVDPAPGFTISVDTATSLVNVSRTESTISVSRTETPVELNLDPKLTLTQIRNNFGAGFGLLYDNANGIFSVNTATHLSQNTTDDLAEGSNLYFTDGRVLSAILNNDVKLKSVSETVVDAGTISGAVSFDVANGSIFTATVDDDITQIVFNNLQAGSSVSLLLRQDATGGHLLQTALLADWIFTDNNTDLEPDPLAYTLISVFYTGTKFVASLTPFVQPTTDKIQEGNVNLYFTQQRARDSISVLAPLEYDGGNGIIGIDDAALFSGKDTDDLAEGNVNLYFTQQRARESISVEGPLEYDTANGVLSIDEGALFSGKDTDDLAEGNVNLYFTEQRARDSISATGNITYDANTGVIDQTLTTDDITEGGNLYYTDQRVKDLLVAGVDGATFGNSVVIQGDLEVQGNTQQVSVIDLLVQDHEIVLNAGNASARDGLITVDRSGSSLANTQIRWNETADAWEFTNDGTNYVPIAASTNDLAEGNANLYFTQTRARDSVSASGDLSYNAASGVFSVTTYKSTDFDTDFAAKTTTDLAEGTNLYFTQARARESISATANIDYDSNTGVISQSLTTDDVTEGNTNLYFPEAPIDSEQYVRKDGDWEQVSIPPGYDSGDFDTDFAAKTTDDLDEGAVNLYYQDARSRAAISTSDTNIEYDSNTGVLGLSNALVDVNSVTAQQNTAPTINRVDSQGREILGAQIDNPGWSFTSFGLGGFDGLSWFSKTVTQDLYFFEADCETTQGSDILNVTSVRERLPDGSITTRTVDDIPVGSIVVVPGLTQPFAPPVVVLSVDGANNTIQVNKNADISGTFNIASGTNVQFTAGGYDSTNDVSIALNPQFLFTPNTPANVLGSVTVQPVTRYAYPATGFTTEDFDWSVGDPSSYSIDSNILRQRMTAKLRLAPTGGIPNFTRGFTVGAETELTNRGFAESFQSFGLNFTWNGKKDDYPDVFKDNPNQTVVPQFLFNSFSEGTPSNIPGRLFFQGFNGNTDTPTSDQYPRAGQGLGTIQWGGPTQNQYLTVSTINTSAGIRVNAASDWISSGPGGLTGNSNMYLHATANKDVRNDVFLSFEKGELFLASGNNGELGQRPISFGPSSGPGLGASATGTYTDISTRWATVNYSNTNALTGSQFAVTNGGTIDVGTVGDMVLALDRLDNSGNVVLPLQTQFLNVQYIDTGSFGAPTTSILFGPAVGVPTGLNTGDPVVIDNIPPGDLADQLNGNTYFAELTTAPTIAVRLWLDSGLSQPLTTGEPNQSIPGATFEYFLDSGVTGRRYSMELAEQSEDLEIYTNGDLHTVIKANGDILDADGNRYITEADFNTLFDARIQEQFADLLQQNAALIQQIAGTTPPPPPPPVGDIDGGTASTTVFDDTLDGGTANTTVFDDTVSGGNAQGDPILEGGSSNTTVFGNQVDGGTASTTEFTTTVDGGNAGGTASLQGGDASTTQFAANIDGGDANTTQFDQTIDGGDA